MHKTIPLLLVLAVGLPALGCSRGKTLARVGGETITDADLESLAEINPRLKPRLATPAGKKKIVEALVEQELFYREANKRGLQRTDAVRKKVDFAKKNVISQAVLENELDKQVKEYYDSHKDEFERLKLSHILIRTISAEPEGKKKPKKPTIKRTDAEASALIAKLQARLQKGEDFAKVASEASEDERTKKAEGSLGQITIHDKRLERWGWLGLAERAFAMNEGETAGPIKTNDGYHLIKVLEGKKFQPLEEADAGIRFRIQSDIRARLLDDLKKKYKVVFLETEKSEMPVPPAAASTPVAPTPGTVPETPPTP